MSDCGCGDWLRQQFAQREMEFTVTDVPPIFDTDYEQVGMRCSHGVRWYTEPTREQVLDWQRGGVR